MKFLRLFVGFAVLFLTVAPTIGQSKVLLTVFYESKCPDSRRFIENQLVPTIGMMGAYIRLQLVPFGKASSATGEFKCQHGNTECRGNMMQDCALRFMAGRSDADKLKYVACEMQSLAGTTGSLQCVRQARVFEQLVQRCVDSRQGIDLQLESERRTQTVAPTFVPTVTVNGRFDQQIQDASQRDLMGTLCHLIPEAEPCARHHGRLATRYLF